MAHNLELVTLINKCNDNNILEDEKEKYVKDILKKEDQWVNLAPDYLVNLLIIILGYYNANLEYTESFRIFTEYEKQAKKAMDPNAYCMLLQKVLHSLGHQDGNDVEILNRYKEFIYYSAKGETPDEDLVLYSFRNEKEYTFKDLEEGKISFSNPITFNDPLDTILYRWLDYRITQSKDPDSKPMLLKRAAEYIKARCFITIKDGNGDLNDIEHANALMWAHYANSHKGICIRYRFKPRFFKQDNATMQFVSVKSMDYSQDSFKIETDLSIEKALYAKNPIWKYENETRIVYYNDSCKDDYADLKLEDRAIIEAIYLGVKCSDETREHIQRFLRGTSIPLFQMHIFPEDVFKLKAKRIG